MPPEITNEQASQLTSWAAQRDALLLDIAQKRDEVQKLNERNLALATSNADLETRINQNLGRIEELKIKEAEYSVLINVDIAKNLSLKTQLETEVTALGKEVFSLSEMRDIYSEMVQNLISLHTAENEMIEKQRKEFAEMSLLSSKQLREIDNVLGKITGEFSKMIEISSTNVEKTNQVINELPKMIFDLQKDILERKHINKVKRT